MPLAEAVKQTKLLDGIDLPLVVRECIDHVEEYGKCKLSVSLGRL